MRTNAFAAGTAALLLGSCAQAAELAGLGRTLQADQGTGASFGLIYDGRASGGPGAPAPVAGGGTGEGRTGIALADRREKAAGPGAAEVPAPATEGRKGETGILAGISNGGQQGALGGFYAVISPAAKLISEGFGRDMSRHYDGPDSGNGGGGAYWAAGIALGVLLYIPALVAGGLGAVGGAVAGAVSEMSSPGSTKGWDVEKRMFG